MKLLTATIVIFCGLYCRPCIVSPVAAFGLCHVVREQEKSIEK